MARVSRIDIDLDRQEMKWRGIVSQASVFERRESSEGGLDEDWCL